jgi:hypothetical protein
VGEQGEAVNNGERVNCDPPTRRTERASRKEMEGVSPPLAYSTT